MSTYRTATLEVANQPLAVLRGETLVAPPRLALLRTPLFHKILLAAVAAVFLTTAGCTVLALKLAGISGVGFRLEDVLARSACIGLLGMEERALYVAGTVDVHSTPGQGTRVRVHIPGPHR